MENLPPFPKISRRRRHLDSATFRILVSLYSLRLNETSNSDPNLRSEIGDAMESDQLLSSDNHKTDGLGETNQDDEEEPCTNPRSETEKNSVSVPDRNDYEIDKDSFTENSRSYKSGEMKRINEEGTCPNPRSEVGTNPMVFERGGNEIIKVSSSGNPKLDCVDEFGKIMEDGEKLMNWEQTERNEEKPQIPKFSHRRRHLDSATYRNLVLLYSHRLDGASNSNPNPRSEIGGCIETNQVTFENLKINELGEKKQDDEEEPCTKPRSEIGKDPLLIFDRNNYGIDKDFSSENNRIDEAGEGSEIRRDPIVFEQSGNEIIKDFSFGNDNDIDGEQSNIVGFEKSTMIEEAIKRAKRKQPTLTEEIKAKKKIAKKKKKKTQKAGEQGVKRLKILPLMKSGKIKDCKFYLKGRCQQGTSCKFSHDATSVTKSQPCGHFARGSCLKGDECPYSHQLSDFPCHLLMNSGTCYRGDSCKFSHKLTNQDSSSMPVTGKSEPCLGTTKLSAADSKRTASNAQSKMSKPFAGNLLTTVDKTTEVPKLTSFLSSARKPGFAFTSPAVEEESESAKIMREFLGL